MKLIKKYLVFILSSLLIGIIFLLNKNIGIKAVDTIKFSFKEMMMVLPPIFVLLGLLDT